MQSRFFQPLARFGHDKIRGEGFGEKLLSRRFFPILRIWLGHWLTMRILRRLFSLPPLDRKLILGAVFLSCFFRVALRVCSLRRLVRFSSRIGARRPSGENPLWIAQRVQWAVCTVSKRIPGLANCLASALTAKALLSLEGHPSVLEIGVKTGDSASFSAHAWLKTQDEILIGSGNMCGYVALPQFDGKDG